MGVQRAALCAREIVAFLKPGLGPTAFAIVTTPPLKPKPFGEKSSNSTAS